ncbi:MAG: hypothetical protein ACK50J_19610, partial [Planctomyces sp.]
THVMAGRNQTAPPATQPEMSAVKDSLNFQVRFSASAASARRLKVSAEAAEQSKTVRAVQ